MSGRTVGNYLLGTSLGKGATGEVFAARHRFLGDEVAIKLLHAHVATSPAATAEFLAEAQRARAIQHPNVVRVSDFGDEPFRYLVMERLAGETLAIRMRAGVVDEPTLRAIVVAIARGAAAAHAAGVVHRDLKPGNVVLVDGGARPVIVDFGISRLATEAALAPGVGTPAYMAPEQLAGDPVGTAADVFALGVIAYEAATGALPFGATVDARRARHDYTPVAGPLAAVIEACLARDPVARPTMAELIERLDDERPTNVVPPQQRARGLRVGLAIGVCLAAGLAIAVVAGAFDHAPTAVVVARPPPTPVPVPLAVPVAIPSPAPAKSAAPVAPKKKPPKKHVGETLD